MSAFADLTAAPVPFNIDGVNVDVHPYTIAEIGALCRACAMQPYKTVVDAGLDDQTCKQMLAECVRKRITPDSPEFVEWATTVDGIVELAFLAVRKKLNREQISALNLGQLKNIGELAFALTSVRQDPTDDEKKTALGNLLTALSEQNSKL